MSKQKNTPKEGLKKVIGPKKPTIGKKTNKVVLQKPIREHVDALLATANKKLKNANLKMVVLKKTGKLEPDIKKFNEAIQSYPKLKGYEFHAFENAEGAFQQSVIKFCCPSDGRPCDFYDESECC